MADYTLVKFNSYGGTNLVVNWNAYGHDSYILADVEHHSADMSVATVYDPTTGRSRQYSMRPTAKAMAIVERHLERMGYKNCVEVRDLTAQADADKL